MDHQYQVCTSLVPRPLFPVFWVGKKEKTQNTAQRKKGKNTQNTGKSGLGTRLGVYLPLTESIGSELWTYGLKIPNKTLHYQLFNYKNEWKSVHKPFVGQLFHNSLMA